MLLLLYWVSLYLLSIISTGSEILNVITVVCYILLLFYFLYRRESFFIICSFFLWAFLTTALSGLILESGLFLPELGSMSTLNGTTAINVSLASITLLIASGIYRLLNERIHVGLNSSFVINSLIERIYPGIVLCATLVVIFISVHYGRPSDFAQDRFYYWNNIAPSWGNLVRLFVEQSSFILGAIYASKRKKYVLAIFFLGIISQVLVGEKFTGIFQMLLFFSICFFITSHIKISKNFFSAKNIVLFLFLGCFFVLLVWASYFSLSGDSSLALASLKTRIAAQSQIWWGLSDVSGAGDFEFKNITKHLLGIDAQPEETGMLYLMSKVMPYKLFSIYQDAGIALTMAFPANIIFFFGPYLSLVICSVLALFLSLALWFTAYTLKNKDYLLLFIAMKVYNIAIQFVLMGRVYLLFEWKIILLLFPLIFAFFAHTRNRRTRSNV